MADYDLTERQKQLLRDLLPTLESGESEEYWISASGGGSFYLLTLADAAYKAGWDTIRESDMEAFIEEGLIKRDLAKNPENYIALTAKIAKAVESNFQKPDPQTAQVINLTTESGSQPQIAIQQHGTISQVQNNPQPTIKEIMVVLEQLGLVDEELRELEEDYEDDPTEEKLKRFSLATVQKLMSGVADVGGAGATLVAAHQIAQVLAAYFGNMF